MIKYQIGRHWIHVSIAASVFLVAACDESIRSSYATAAEARTADAGRGWLPTELPDSSYAISESHKLDVNTGIGSFRFEVRDDASFRAKLQPLPAVQLQHIKADHAKLQRLCYNFYADSGFLLAVNWQTRHVQFWGGLNLQ